MTNSGLINGLRGLAIIAVVFHHSFYEIFIRPGGWHLFTVGFVRLPFVQDGYLGVDLFFILSGFVLFMPFARGDRLLDRAGIRKYYHRRFFRLAPLFYFNALIAMVFFYSAAALHSRQAVSQAVRLATGTFIFFPGSFFPPANWVMWSLGVEIWFSALFPLLAWLFLRLGWPAALLLAVIVAALVRTNFADVLVLHSGVFGFLDEFAFGMAAAAICASRADPEAGVLGRRWPVRWPVPVVGLLLAIIAVPLRDLELLQPALLLTVPRTMMAFGVLLLVWGGINGRPSRLTRGLCNWPLQLMGMMCYSIYLWHGIMLRRFYPQLSADPMVTVSAFYLVYLAAVLAVAAVTYRCIEFRRVADWRALFLPARSPGEVQPIRLGA